MAEQSTQGGYFPRLERRTLLGGIGAAALAAPWISRAHAASDVIRIGVLNDQSGVYADNSGLGSVHATTMAVAERGGTVIGKKIDVIARDHQNNADIGMTVVREWLGAGDVDLIMDIGNSSIALAVQSLIRDAGRIAIITSPQTSDLYGKACSPNSFVWAQDSWSSSVALIRSLIANGYKTFFMITVNYTVGITTELQGKAEIERQGGKFLGSTRHPIGETDYSAYLLTAQSSGAEVVILNNSGTDFTNCFKQAGEFGLRKSQVVAAPTVLITDIDALGLKTAQGLVFPSSWYWDMDDPSRAWAKQYFQSMKKMPNDYQAATYSGARQYLNAIDKVGTKEPKAVIAAIREMPVLDCFAKHGRVREDNKMVFDRYLTKAKSPDQSKYPWDYLQIMATIPADQAFRPVSDGHCPFVTKA